MLDCRVKFLHLLDISLADRNAISVLNIILQALLVP
jgi:hypothetical protein